MLDRKESAGDGGKIFNTNYDKVSKYAKSLGTGIYRAKDLRTIRANEIAQEEIGTDPRNFSTDKERSEFIKSVAVKVSGVLGNRPKQALDSYINPNVFDNLTVSEQKAA